MFDIDSEINRAIEANRGLDAFLQLLTQPTKETKQETKMDKDFIAKALFGRTLDNLTNKQFVLVHHYEELHQLGVIDEAFIERVSRALFSKKRDSLILDGAYNESDKHAHRNNDRKGQL